jgi:hypothetical protein
VSSNAPWKQYKILVLEKKFKKKNHLKDNKKLSKNYRCNSKNKALRLVENDDE